MHDREAVIESLRHQLEHMRTYSSFQIGYMLGANIDGIIVLPPADYRAAKQWIADNNLDPQEVARIRDASKFSEASE